MIRIHTLGGLTVRGDDGQRVTGSVAQPRRMALLALLARASERGITREKVLSLLWPDADDDRGPRTLAQALYALRKDLGADEAITGSKELRLDPALVSTDVAEFAAAVTRGDDARAATLYEGAFLDGFHLPGAEEFSRWVERERSALAQDHTRVLESLARAAHSRGETQAAVTWWRKLAALEPLNARVAVGLMEALADGGDRAAAIRHAHIYELLVQEELDLPPDAAVRALAERLRNGSTPEAGAPPPARTPVPEHSATAPPAPSLPGAAVVATNRDPAVPRTPSRVPRGLVVPALIALAAVVTWVVARSDRSPSPATAQGPVVAVGHIASFGTDSATQSLAGAVAELLATGLARVPGLKLVSQSRILELMRSGGVAGESAGALMDAARRAGATELVDGTLYARAGGLLRLDLRRVDLASGAVQDARTIEGQDLFSLVDSGTARLVAALGSTPPGGSVADVTTRSEAAFRTYVEGIRAYYQGDNPTALRLFDAALESDPQFALAAYYGALAASLAEPSSWVRRMERARTLATRATDRERLIITADWASRTSSPSMRAVAETLASRYPAEVEGHLYSGIAKVVDGEALEGIAALERAVAMDSTGPRAGAAPCVICEALQWIVGAWEIVDSLPAAERAARRWRRLQPTSWAATRTHLDVLAQGGRLAEADSIFRANVPSSASFEDVLVWQVAQAMYAEDYARVDRLLREQGGRLSEGRRGELYWLSALSLREQGRLSAAVESARQMRRIPEGDARPGAPRTTSALEAQLMFEAGRGSSAAALFDSVAHLPLSGGVPSQRARQAAWMWTHQANALAQVGDTAHMARLADSVRIAGAQSGFGRDHRLYHHVLGLLLTARGREAEAMSEFRSAIFSMSNGYTRTNVELAGLLMRAGQPREAIAVLQPALRGPLESNNLYVSRTELHDMLARAWDAAHEADSAAAHYRHVAQAWAGGDAPYRIRADSARARSAAPGASR